MTLINGTLQKSLETGITVSTVFSGVCGVWIVVGNTLTLIAVCGVTVERQKKQVVGLLVADIYNGVIGLPIYIMQLYHLDVFQNHLVCILSFGLADFGAVSLLSACAVLCFTTFLNIRFPLWSQRVSNWETQLFAAQWLFSIVYTFTITVLLSRLEQNTEENCDWSDLPKWYFYSYLATFFPIITLAFVSAVAVLCVARQHAVAIESVEISVNSERSTHSQNRKVKHSRLAKMVIVAFTLTWVPFTVTASLALFPVPFAVDDEFFFYTYVSLLAVAASIPVFYAYAFTGVRKRLVFILTKKLCK